ncbi:putative uncharacterized protein [Klebsiella pneumoniae]|nr:putative uncharacterized protein [Klebsiella pneumoniae]
MEFNDEAAYGHRKWILKGGKGRRWTISLTVEENLQAKSNYFTCNYCFSQEAKCFITYC